MERKCSNCNVDLVEVGNMNFRVGGFTGIGGMFLGGWNDLMEQTQTFTLFKCPQCGKVEFYEPSSVSDQGQKKHHFL
ncbi:nucleotide-binding protein [Thermogymnomonas acidicola]|nr:nucleotide-binding protein [Thermogymnomonas acidicola]